VLPLQLRLLLLLPARTSDAVRLLVLNPRNRTT
jgi:hypothetical protein